MEITNSDNWNKNRRRKLNVDISTMIYGKIPPQAKELEEAVLGSIMLNKSAYFKVADILKPHCFYVDANQKIFKSFNKLYEKGIPIDILTTVEELKSSEELDIVGGPFAITKLTNNVVSDANIEAHARIIFEKYISRKLIEIAGLIINDAYEDAIDTFDLLDDSTRKIRDISIEVEATSKSPMANIAKNIIEKFDKKAYYSNTDEEDPDAVYTGFNEWDAINGQLLPELYVIAARPAVGKSVHMVEILCRAGKKIKIGCINGEMPNEQLLIRMGCNLLEINNKLWKKRYLITEEDQDLVKEAMQAVIQLKVELHDKRDMNSISRRITSWVIEEDVKLIVGDILTIFTVPDDLAKYMNETQQMNWKLQVFGFLCKTLNVPIILYTHMNREVERRTTKEPVLSDLKQSGNIEDFAYQVSFLHRPELYEIDKTQTEDVWGEDIRGLMYQIIVKHRGGELGRLKFDAKLHMSKLIEREASSPVEGWKPSVAIPFDGKLLAANDDSGTVEDDEDAPF